MSVVFLVSSNAITNTRPGLIYCNGNINWAKDVLQTLKESDFYAQYANSRPLFLILSLENNPQLFIFVSAPCDRKYCAYGAECVQEGGEAKCKCMQVIYGGIVFFATCPGVFKWTQRIVLLL